MLAIGRESLCVGEPASFRVIKQSTVVQSPHVLLNETVFHGRDLLARPERPHIGQNCKSKSGCHSLLVFGQISRLNLVNMSVGTSEDKWGQTE